nr:hypothetical protein [Candidatus Gracilibacteria bacterium]
MAKIKKKEISEMAPRERDNWKKFEEWKRAFIQAHPTFRQDVPDPQQRKMIYEAELRAQGIRGLTPFSLQLPPFGGFNIIGKNNCFLKELNKIYKIYIKNYKG